MHLGQGFDADDDPDNLNIDILDDLDDDPDDFTKTSDTWTNSPKLTVIPLPSNLRMLLREGQANDALHNLQIHLCNKAILFRTTVRQAKSQALKTRAWSQVTSVQQAVSLHASIYTKTRKQMMQLEPGQDQLQKYEPLLHEHLKISTAIGDLNARVQMQINITRYSKLISPKDTGHNEEREEKSLERCPPGHEGTKFIDIPTTILDVSSAIITWYLLDALTDATQREIWAASDLLAPSLKKA
ncbi:hypothetical protein EDB19DRAFT_1914522 [Suillus lakei]|nr:hypothetical protein EDB19DRAFT_1914522 [Suillus lakei]